MKMIFQYLLPQSFFGPVHSWRESILEEFFALQLHLNMSYSEVHRLPIRYRTWFLRRLVQHFDEKNKAYDEAKSNANNKNSSPDNLLKLSQFESQIKSKF